MGSTPWLSDSHSAAGSVAGSGARRAGRPRGGPSVPGGPPRGLPLVTAGHHRPGGAAPRHQQACRGHARGAQQHGPAPRERGQQHMAGQAEAGHPAAAGGAAWRCRSPCCRRSPRWPGAWRRPAAALIVSGGCGHGDDAAPKATSSPAESRRASRRVAMTAARPASTARPSAPAAGAGPGRGQRPSRPATAGAGGWRPAPSPAGPRAARPRHPARRAAGWQVLAPGQLTRAPTAGSGPASKQVRSPVWQAPPAWSTLTSTASPSQSSATEFTRCT